MSCSFLITVAPCDTALPLPTPGGETTSRPVAKVCHLCQRPRTFHQGEAGGCPGSSSRHTAGPCRLGSSRDPEKGPRAWLQPRPPASVPWDLGLLPPRDRPSAWHWEAAWHILCPHFLTWSRRAGWGGVSRVDAYFPATISKAFLVTWQPVGGTHVSGSLQHQFHQRIPGKRTFRSKTNVNMPRFNKIYMNFLRPAEDFTCLAVWMALSRSSKPCRVSCLC